MLFWTVEAHGHLWLFWRGVVIWSRLGDRSILAQTAPRTAECLDERGEQRRPGEAHADEEQEGSSPLDASSGSAKA